jgi:hypothetical protein
MSMKPNIAQQGSDDLPKPPNYPQKRAKKLNIIAQTGADILQDSVSLYRVWETLLLQGDSHMWEIGQLQCSKALSNCMGWNNGVCWAVW